MSDRRRSFVAALAILISLPALAGCGRQATETAAPEKAERADAVPREAKPSDAPAAHPQGIRGQVVKLVGSFLPGAGPEQGSREPLAVPVHVFGGRVEPFDKPDPKHPALVQIVRADAEGRFELPLPPGEYTVIPEIDGQLYLNNWLDDGSWATVKVEPDEWAEHTIEDVREAAF
ncbi:MAG: hypothetical protein WD069_22330 [Planctomycetales bacterium]